MTSEEHKHVARDSTQQCHSSHYTRPDPWANIVLHVAKKNEWNNKTQNYISIKDLIKKSKNELQKN
jgi:hypothetical protein